MKTGKFGILIMSAMVAATYSCSNDDDSKPAVAQPPKTMLVSKEFSSDDSNPLISTSTFSYDDRNRLTAQMTSNDSREYTRDADGRIIKTTIDNGLFIDAITYTYNASGKLQKLERRNPTQGVIEKREYTYLSDRIEERYYNTEGDFTYRYEYYYSANGTNINVMKRYFGDGTFADSQEYIFDDRKGIDQIAPYSNLPKPFYNANNVTKTTFLNATGGIVFIRNCELTYDAEGNPLTLTDSDATHPARHFEYIAK